MTCYCEDIIDGFSFLSFKNEDECKKEYSKHLKAHLTHLTSLKVEPKTRNARHHTVEPRVRNKASVVQPKEAIRMNRLEKAVIKRETATNLNGQPVFRVPLKVEPVNRYHSSEPRTSASSAPIQPNANDINRPEKTYSELINEAFTNSNQMALSVREICQYIAINYDYFDLSEEYWQRGVGALLYRKGNFTRIFNLGKENTYIPVKPKDVGIKKELQCENDNELNSLRESIKVKDDELKCLKETLARERQENQNVIDLLRYEFQIKLSELQEERKVITTFLSNYASQCAEID